MTISGTSRRAISSFDAALSDSSSPCDTAPQYLPVLCEVGVIDQPSAGRRAIPPSMRGAPVGKRRHRSRVSDGPTVRLGWSGK